MNSSFPPRFTISIPYTKTRQQWDARFNRNIPLTLYIRAKQGRAGKNDRIYLIGIRNEETLNYEEFAFETEDPLIMFKKIFENENRYDKSIELLQIARAFLAELERIFENKFFKMKVPTK